MQSHKVKESDFALFFLFLFLITRVHLLLLFTLRAPWNFEHYSFIVFFSSKKNKINKCFLFLRVN